MAREGNTLTLKSEEGISTGAIVEGEPAVLFFVSETDIVISGCIIIDRMSNDTLVLQCDNGHAGGQNKRLYERYPVSYYADLKVVNEPKRYVAFLKDISKYGLRIITDAELRIGSKVEISLYLEKRILFITTLIVHGTRSKHYHEYGTLIRIEDYHSVREMTNLIRITTQDYMDRFTNKNLLDEQVMLKYDLNYDPATNSFILNENRNIEAIMAKFGDIIRRTRY